jgi:prepilin-type processing-associated H-X9-DG protein
MVGRDVLSAPRAHQQRPVKESLLNVILVPSRFDAFSLPTPNSDQPENVFQTESHITQPTLLPVAADASWELGYPHDADEAGALDQFDQFEEGQIFNMRVFCVPRHGSKASKVTANGPWPKTEPLPGAINMAYFDGHVQLIQLEKLWQLRWHRNFIPRARVSN